MIIRDVNLDSLSKREFIEFIKSIISYYCVQYSELYELSLVNENVNRIERDL